jgi:rare lipoprotein A
MLKKINILLLFIFIINSKIGLTSNIQVEDFRKNIEQSIITQVGIASHYGAKFHKRKTASGEFFDLFAYSSAHKQLPFGTIVKIINKENNLTTLVRINDRGPFIKGRVIDLSHKAAKAIDGMDNPNVAIQYFDNNKILENIDSNYFLGYSLQDSLIIINKNGVNIIDSAYNFDGIMNLYLNVSDDIIKYIFIKAKKISRQCQYFIGTIK